MTQGWPIAPRSCLHADIAIFRPSPCTGIGYCGTLMLENGGEVHHSDSGQEQPRTDTNQKNARLSRQFRAFRHRNYRLFFGGQLISLTGTWLQQVAQGWLVLKLTNSALLLGIVSAISSIPILIFSLWAGLVADRFNKRNILVITQSSAMILAFALAVLTYRNTVTVYHVIIIGFLLGAVNAFDAPTRQSFVVEMVGREDLMNAITLNSAMFNGARVVGPAIAGIVIAVLSLSGAFFLNALSFIAVIIGLLLMRIEGQTPRANRSAIEGLREGLQFIRGNRLVGSLLLLAGSVSVFATAYMVLMPKFARDVMGLGPKGMGFLMSAVGLGALCGAIFLSSLGDFRAKGRLLLTGNITFSVMLVLFSLSRSMPISIGLLFIAGWGMMTNMALTNTLIQTSVPDEIRGRVMSAYTLMFMGMMPVGSFQAGVVAHFLGVPESIRIGAIISAVAALALSKNFLDGGMRAREQTG